MKKFYRVIQVEGSYKPRPENGDFETVEAAEESARRRAAQSAKASYEHQTLILEVVSGAKLPVPDIKIEKISG